MVLQYYVSDSETGNKVNVAIKEATSDDFETTKKGWQTDWTSDYIMNPRLEKYAAKTENGELIALGAYQVRENSVAVYIAYVESQPESNPTLTFERRYTGIGRMMLAFGIQLSIDAGKSGVIVFEAKTTELQKHYIQDFRAVPVAAARPGGPATLMIADEAAKELFFTYLN